MLRILVDLHRRQECDIEIARGETESPAAIFAEYFCVGGVAILAHGAPYTGQAMIVCSDRHRPVAGDGIIVRQQLGGGFGCRKRVVAFIEHMVDLQVAAAGTGRKLPDTGRPNMGPCTGIIGRLDMRQCRQLVRHTASCELGVYVLPPETGAFETFAEAI